MTLFLILCAAMVAIALVFVLRPLARGKARIALPIVAAVLPAIAVLLYLSVGHRNWQRDEEATHAQVEAQRQIIANITKLEEAVRESPNDVAAALNLGEALVAIDERSLAGRAGQLFESALARQPNNMKALWYGAMAALATGKLPLARERLQRVVAQNPPENIRAIIERQIQDISQQLTESAAVAPGRAINVEVLLAPTLQPDIDKTTPLFVLVRDPEKGGPPLAAVRRVAGDLPLSVTLSDNDAMVRGRGLSSAARVQVVARISKSGMPQAQHGDLFGEAAVELKDAAAVAVKIVIDRKVEQ